MSRNRSGSRHAPGFGANFRDDDHCERQELAADAERRIRSIGTRAAKLERSRLARCLQRSMPL
jgi:hypothetical protein